MKKILHKSIVATAFACALLLATAASAAKVYKWIDEDGSVTYRDKPPPTESAGEVEVKDIDSEKNVIQFEGPPDTPEDKAQPAPAADTKNKDKDKEPPPKAADGSLERYITTEEEERRIEEQKQEELRRMQEQGSRFRKF